MEEAGDDLIEDQEDLDAFAERFVRSINEECLNQMIFFFSERSLRYAIPEYVGHYCRERNHQGLEGYQELERRMIQPQFRIRGVGEVERKERLGGMLNFYYREAA